MNFFKNTAWTLKTKIVGKSLEDTLEEITSATDENLNVPTRILQEIAEKTFNDADYDIINKYIMRQFGSNERPWRKMLKILNLIEYLLKNGSPRFVDDTREEIYHIRLLTRYCQLEKNEDKGGLVREKATKIDELVQDTTFLDQERRKADAERRKLKNMGVLGNAPASTTSNLPAKTYQAFSSEDMNSIKTPEGGVVHRKTESDDGIDVSDDEADKEFNDLDDDGVVKSDMINKIDLTKDEEAPKVTNLIDFDDTPVQSTPATAQTPVNGLRDVSASHQNIQEAAQPSPIWNWDEKPYNKWANTKTEENNTNITEFDWSKAPSSDNLDAFDNSCKRASSTPVQNENKPSDLNVNLATHTSETGKPVNKMFNQNERNMIDLHDMKDFVEKSKEVLCKQQEIDELFNNMSVNSNNGMQMGYGQQYYNGFINKL